VALRNSKPLGFSPSTVCDALDSTDLGAGSMAALTNLIPDPTTRNPFQCRPGFGGIPGAGFISCMKVVGNRVYGMVASTTELGRDEPFCYDIAADAFVTITGTLDATTLPLSPPVTGLWQPPIIDTVGAFVLFAHAGYQTVGNLAGFLDISDPAIPVWTAQSMTLTTPQADPAPPLVTDEFNAAPISVASFGDRAYWMIVPPNGDQPAVMFSDILDPTNFTVSTLIVNNVITFDDRVALTAFGKMGLNNQLGGIVQALYVFKGVSNIYQLAGDPALANNPLTRNALNVTTGTFAPLTVCSVPQGMMFMSPEGFRLIDTSGHVSDPIGIAGTGVTMPFSYAVEPTRACATAGGNTMRASVQNGFAPGTPQEEYFYNFARGIWTGPHTFAASLIQPYNNTFIKTPIGVLASLWQSDAAQVSTSTYVENDVQLTWRFQTAMLPDTDQMCQNAMIETTFYTALTAAAGAVSCLVQDQDGLVLDQVTIPQPGAATLWGNFQWGQASWLGAASALQPRQMFWTQPIVFQRMAFVAVGQCGQGIRVGRVHFRYEMLGYLLPYPVTA